MFRHYLITAARSLAHHRLYSFINIAGLSIGLACAILITLYVRDQLSYDGWIPGTTHLYRLELTFHFPGRSPLRLASVPFPAVTAVRDQLPEVKAATHLLPEEMTVTVGDRQFRETAAVVDPNFFQIISLPFVKGDPARVFAQPESIVLSQSIARKYFGDVDPVGRVLTVVLQRNSACEPNDRACLSAVYPLTVTGVLRDLPHNTQLAVDLVVPNTSRADGMSRVEKADGWTGTDGDYGYVELVPGADPAAVLAGLKQIVDRAVDLKKYGVNLPASALEEYRLTPFRDVHLTSDQYGGMRPPGSRTTVYGLAIVALLIVLIACINFMNLSTARATLRTREIALRKLGGATRRQLIVQFLGESILTTLVSLAIALSLVEVLLPVYDHFLGEPLRFRYPADWPLLALLITGSAAVGLGSGLYPAIVLSAFRPVSGLKASVSGPTGSGAFRSALVVAQFAISIGLAIGAIVVFSQIGFTRRIDLGFARDGVVVIRGLTNLTVSARRSLTSALSTSPDVAAVAISNAVPFNIYEASNLPIRLRAESQSFTAHIIAISPEFMRLYGMQLLAGRFLSSSYGTDLSSGLDIHNVLINATGARRLGLSPQQAVGKTIAVTVNGTHVMNIVGVVGDAKLDGIRDALQPTVYYADTVDRGVMTLLSVRTHRNRMPQAVSFIDKTWRSFAPGVAIDRYLLNDAFDGLFRSDERAGAILAVFVAIAIFIACLGLFGLAVFTAERRTKEIGLRKVSGARTGDIARLMLWRIAIPVVVANAIAWPIAYVCLHRWLEGYAYRIALSPLYFLAAGGGALLIAWATVLAHALRLARANPVHALRYE